MDGDAGGRLDPAGDGLFHGPVRTFPVLDVDARQVSCRPGNICYDAGELAFKLVLPARVEAVGIAMDYVDISQWGLLLEPVLVVPDGSADEARADCPVLKVQRPDGTEYVRTSGIGLDQAKDKGSVGVGAQRVGTGSLPE